MGYLLTASKQHKDKIILLAMGLFMFLAPFSVSGIYQKLTPVPSSVLVTFFTTCLVFFVFLLHIKEREKFEKLNREQRFYLSSIYLPAVLSVLAAFFNLTYMLSSQYVDYVMQSMPTRMINLTMYFVLFYSFFKLIRFLSEKTLLTITRFYLYGILVVVIVGIWQFLHFMIGYPMLDLNTRSFVHSVESDVLFNFRLTSLTDEPSYLVPFLIDAIVIGFVVYSKKTKYFLQVLIPSLFVLVFSFSVSGYANLMMLMAFVFVVLLTTKVENKKKIFLYSLYALIPLLLIALFKWDFVLQALQPILGRFDTLFDIQRHSRLYMLVMPIVWLFDYSIVNGIFGFGPGSYWFLNQTKFLYHQGPVSATSNNIYIDLLFEHGVFGFLFLISMFVFVFYRLFRQRNEHKYFLYALILWVHLGITAMYRADFASPRFWVMIIIIFIFMELGKRGIGKNSAIKNI
ncbi:MAG: O-antigen ligase family protein [Bacillota bacterium]